MPVIGRQSKRHSDGRHTRQTIDRLREDTRKSVWYVFDTLENVSTGKVTRSQLKVLTSKIGWILSMDKAEEILNQDNSSNTLSYHEYIGILEEQLFSKVDNTTLEKLKLTDEQLEEVHRNCWNLYFKVKKEPTGSTENLVALPEEICYKLWRVYNFLAEEDEKGMPLLPLQLHIEEAKIIMEVFVEYTSQVTLLSQIDGFVKMYSTSDVLSFQQFETMFIQKFSRDLTDSILKQATKDLYQKFICDTVVKGMLCKRGYKVKSWKDRWMVLKTKQLSYFTSSAEREKKGDIQLDATCRVEVITDAETKGGSKPNRFVLTTSNKPYEMSAHDIKTRNDWVTALQRAIDRCSDENYHFHRREAKERQRCRLEKRRLKEDEERRKRQEEEEHIQMMDQFNKRLKDEEEQRLKQQEELERARINQLELEERLRAEEALRRQEQERLRELEELNRRLEQLLEEERQAKRDEEIVRALQARLLEEELEKREELEALRKQQEEMLQLERSRREGLEEQHSAQMRKLEEAEETLQNLESQRKEAEQKMKDAADKLQIAEKERIKLQHKVDLWKTPTVRLARPIQPKQDKVTTHRGAGAFCDEDFVKHDIYKREPSLNEKERSVPIDFTLAKDTETQSMDDEAITTSENINAAAVNDEDNNTTVNDKETLTMSDKSEVNDDEQSDKSVNNQKENTINEIKETRETHSDSEEIATTISDDKVI